MYEWLNSPAGVVGFTLVAATIAAIVIYNVHKFKSHIEQEPSSHREWDFSHLTLQQARGRFAEAIARHPYNVWLTLIDDRHVRLHDTLQGTIMVIAPSTMTYGVTWPPQPGKARVRLFYVSPRECTEWVCDVQVDPDGNFETPYNFRTKEPINAVGRGRPIPPDQLGRWAKRISMDPNTPKQ